MALPRIFSRLPGSQAFGRCAALARLAISRRVASRACDSPHEAVLKGFSWICLRTSVQRFPPGTACTTQRLSGSQSPIQSWGHARESGPGGKLSPPKFLRAAIHPPKLKCLTCMRQPRMTTSLSTSSSHPTMRSSKAIPPKVTAGPSMLHQSLTARDHSACSSIHLASSCSHTNNHHVPRLAIVLLSPLFSLPLVLECIDDRIGDFIYLRITE